MKSENGESQPLRRQIVAMLTTSLLCLSAGLSNGLTAVLMPKFAEMENYYWLEEYGSFIAVLLPLAIILGSLACGILMDYLGRKSVHIILAFSFIISWQAFAYAQDFQIVLFGRFIARFSFGATKPTVAVYLAEISDPKYRGVFLICPAVATTSGILIGHVLGRLHHWKVAILLCTIPNTLLFIMLVYFQESPYWLISKGNVNNGIQSFRWFRGKRDLAEIELRDILDKEVKGSLNAKEYLKVITKISFVKQLVIVFFIFLVVQICRINAMPTYTREVFERMYIDEDDFDTLPLIVLVDSTRVLVCLVLCFFGNVMHRKSMFVFCVLASSVMTSAIVVFFITETKLPVGAESILLALLFTGIYSGIQCLAWTFVAELFPTNVRGLGSGLAGVISWILLILCQMLTRYLVYFVKPILYFTFAFSLFVCAIVLHFILPETRRKRLQDIEENNKNKYSV